MIANEQITQKLQQQQQIDENNEEQEWQRYQQAVELAIENH